MKLITLMINNQQDVPIDEMRILTSRFDFVIYQFSVQRLRFPVFDHGNHQCRRVYLVVCKERLWTTTLFIQRYLLNMIFNTTFLKELKVNNDFHERSPIIWEIWYSHFDSELSILEKKERKLVVINNNTSWKHAVKLLLKEETELHGDSFSGGRREKRGGRNEKRVGERRRLPPLNMASCGIAI